MVDRASRAGRCAVCLTNADVRWRRGLRRFVCARKACQGMSFVWAHSVCCCFSSGVSTMDPCGVCGTSIYYDDDVVCDECDRGFHLACLNLPRVPVGPFRCPTCSASPAQCAPGTPRRFSESLSGPPETPGPRAPARGRPSSLSSLPTIAALGYPKLQGER